MRYSDVFNISRRDAETQSSPSRRPRTAIPSTTRPQRKLEAPMPYLDLIVIAVCAIAFYRAGRMEHSWGLLWAALSIAISMLILFVLHWGTLTVFAGQAALFVAITLWRMRQKP